MNQIKPSKSIRVLWGNIKFRLRASFRKKEDALFNLFGCLKGVKSVDLQNYNLNID